MVSIKDATKNRIDTGVPTESLQIRKQEKSKWEFQHSGIKAKKEKSSTAKEPFQFTFVHLQRIINTSFPELSVLCKQKSPKALVL